MLFFRFGDRPCQQQLQTDVTIRLEIDAFEDGQSLYARAHDVDAAVEFPIETSPTGNIAVALGAFQIRQNRGGRGQVRLCQITDGVS